MPSRRTAPKLLRWRWCNKLIREDSPGLPEGHLPCWIQLHISCSPAGADWRNAPQWPLFAYLIVPKGLFVVCIGISGSEVPKLVAHEWPLMAERR